MFKKELKQNLLTSRQREILGHVAKGYTNAEIAHHLCLSENTIKVHMARLFHALGVSNRTEAALWFQSSNAKMARPVQKKVTNTLVLIMGEFKSNTLPCGFLRRIKDQVVSLLSLKTFIDVILEPDLGDLHKNYFDALILKAGVEQIDSAFDLNVRIEDYKRHSSIWNQSLSNTSLSGKCLEGWCAQAIAANAFRLLISHYQILEPENLDAPIESSCNVIFGLRQLDLRSRQSVGKASRLFAAMLKSNPNHIFALYGLAAIDYFALVSLYKGDSEEAKTRFIHSHQKLKSLSQCRAESWYVQALRQILAKNIPGAIFLLKNAIRIDPSFQVFYALLSQLYCFTGEHQKAFELMDYGVSLCPEFRYVGSNLVLLSIIFYGLEEYEKSISVLEESFYLQSPIWFSRGIYVSSLYMNGQKAKAKEEVKGLQKNLDTVDKAIIQNFIDLLEPKMKQRLINSLSKVQVFIKAK